MGGRFADQGSMAQRGRWLRCLRLVNVLATTYCRLKHYGEQIALLSVACFQLENLNVLCLPTLRATLHVEADRLAFLQRTETVRLDSREVNEYVFAVLT
jgi:hypothetical protein